MTRLDPVGEPSMEEILASIRRIIAEDPPSTPASEPAPASAEVAKTPVREEHTIAASSRAEPAPSSAAGSRFDIDAQLADVLGGMSKAAAAAMPAAESMPAPAPEPAPQPASSAPLSVQAAIDSLRGPSPEPRTAPARQGFTMRRDGFIPQLDEPQPKSQPQLQTEPKARAAEPDPFEFTLGPSPFARDTKPAPDARRTSIFDDLGTHVPSRDAAPAPVLTAAPKIEADPAADVRDPVFGRMSAPEPAPVANEPAVSPADVVSRIAASDPAPAMGADIGKAAVAEGFPISLGRNDDKGPAVEETASAVFEPKFESDSAVAPAAIEAAAEAPAPEIHTSEPAPAEAATEPAVSVSPVLEALKTASRVRDALDLSPSAPPIASLDRPVFAELTETAPVIIEAEADVHEEPAHTPVFTDPVEATVEEPNARAGSQRPPLRFSPPSVANEASDAAAPPRTMEDTVAELLRPMLRNWLAENMPKIVERALRKEIEDSSSPEHKAAAE